MLVNTPLCRNPRINCLPPSTPSSSQCNSNAQTLSIPGRMPQSPPSNHGSKNGDHKNDEYEEFEPINEDNWDCFQEINDSPPEGNNGSPGSAPPDNGPPDGNDGPPDGNNNGPLDVDNNGPLDGNNRNNGNNGNSKNHQHHGNNGPLDGNDGPPGGNGNFDKSSESDEQGLACCRCHCVDNKTKIIPTRPRFQMSLTDPAQKSSKLSSLNVGFTSAPIRRTVLNWFEVCLLQEDEHVMLSCVVYWYHFVTELWSTFGVANPKEEAAKPLEALTMKSSKKIANYTIQFLKHSSKLSWNEDSSTTSAASAWVSKETIDLSSIPDEYHKFADVFSKSHTDSLAPHQPYDLKINLEDGSQPPVGTIYSLSPSKLEALCEFINKHLSIGFICPTSSPHSAPVLFVKKKDSFLQLCVDFRGLNWITKKDHYPLPPISNLLNSPHKACIYTKIDLHHAYHLICIAKGNKWKTAFRTHYGSFEWLVMPFGLTNAPAAFQWFMNDMFSDLLDISVTVYLDNILIYSNNLNTHCQHVKEVLCHLHKHGLFAKVEKCEFHSKSIKIIKEWPEPKKVKDIQSFLDFANFYRCFIYNYSNIIVPLTRLTCKSVPWNFNNKCCTTFNNLKEAFTSTPILTHRIPDSQIIVETNASDYALAAILLIITDDNEVHLIAFCTFNSAESNYDTHDKELLAIFEAFQIWQHYLEGSGLPINVLPIPEQPWNSISMDFIEKLPTSSRYDTILVIINRLSKQAIFIPTHNTITSTELACLFVIHVFSKHGVPSHVTSNHGSEFVSHFFHSLGTALDMRLHFTLRYHPEGDRQTEHTNQTLEQYLRVYCNYQQVNWSKLLLLTEFMYNNAPSATTGISPFFANKGYHPNISIYPEHDITSTCTQEFAVNLQELQETLKSEISADSQRLPAPNFKIGQ
ncbi:hypothetical protein NP233_g6936 [Leucocoprinus birnbaumii]|uniref:Pol protein n=1 Tax=Leucocoprinus birnbaumii TaxID=56174 RepID=A0AAD5VQ75_9AGAR|nr:hypothetical protein NP233_g6936 [Leucocoprinus birnbaumii]